MIVALSFDADQTLWDFDAVKRRALRATIAEMERRGDVPAGAVTPEAMDQARDVLVQRFRGATHRLEEVRERSFAEVLTAQGHPTPDAAAAVLVEHYMNIRFNQIELFADVAPAIALLKGRYRLGLLSNGNTYPERCGLHDTFDAVVLGPDHGFEKPDPGRSPVASAGVDVPARPSATTGTTSRGITQPVPPSTSTGPVALVSSDATTRCATSTNWVGLLDGSFG
jgi:putative hydrolase of the HAD superfamily